MCVLPIRTQHFYCFCVILISSPTTHTITYLPILSCLKISMWNGNVPSIFSDISVRVVCPCSSSDCSSSRVIWRWWIGYVNIVIMHDNTQHVVWLMLKNNEEATCSVTMPYRLPDDGVETSCLRARSNKIWVGRLAFLNSGSVKLRRPSAERK